MNRLYKSIFVNVLILPVMASIGQTGSASDKSRLLDSVYQDLYTSGSFNGNILIAEKGTVIFEKSYGIANEKTRQKLNTKTVFELASVSKQFTAMAIVLLQKRGKLKYDDLLSKYIPELNFYDPVTIRNLLNHTGGMPDYMDLFKEKWDRTKIAANEDVITEFVKYRPPLEFSPNEKWRYSNTDYVLLASVIERVAQKPYSVFMKENIFDPLQMKSTFVYRRIYAPQKIKNYAEGYGTDSLLEKVSPYSFGSKTQVYYLDGVVGDGMINSNLEDMLKWDRALYTNRLVDANDKNDIFSSVKTNDGKESNYGFGWRVYDDKKYGKIVDHSGSWAGYITYIERHLDTDKTVVILQNVNTPVSKIGLNDVRKILYNIQLDNKPKTTIDLDPSELDQYTGVYAGNDFRRQLVVFKKGNKLAVHYLGSPVSGLPLDAYPAHTFRCDPQAIKLVFNPAESSLLYTDDDKTYVLHKQK